MPTPIQEVIVQSDLLTRAYEFAKRAHQGQERKNGEPYLNHCIATATVLSEWNLDETTIAAGLMHDTPKVKHEEKTLKEIEASFGEEVARLVSGVIAIGKVPYRGTENKIENLRRYIVYTSKDVRVMLIKFAARLDTLKSLYIFPPGVQRTIALKTMEIYAALANQLGMYRVARDLEDLAFPYLYPKDYQSLIEKVRDRFEEREEYLTKLKPFLAAELEANGVAVVKIETRAKHYFSLFQKLLRYDMDLERIHDLVAIRVIVRDIGDCYHSLGIIHKHWPPLPGRIKDYIAAPKPNGYRSLHTTVLTAEGKNTEIQIRTEEMHEIAELGIAAHYAYRRLKDAPGYLDRRPAVPHVLELELTKELRKFPHELTGVEFFKNNILVLTPKGDVFELPAGSTPVDFAYKVHTGIGDRCAGVKVNGILVPLDTELRSGDVVHISTQKNKHPSKSWLTFAKTSHAKESIRAALRGRPGNKLVVARREQKIQFAIRGKDRPGILHEITRAFSERRVKIKKCAVEGDPRRNLRLVKIDCETLSEQHLKKLTDKLKGVSGVAEVKAVRI